MCAAVRLPGLSAKDGFLRHPFDLENNVNTSGLVHSRHLATGHPHDPHSAAYYGIAPSVFEAICSRWRTLPDAAKPGPLEEYTFIDFGAGMGRALLLAALKPFREVVGVELNPSLARIAQSNIDLWQKSRRARCPMRIVCGDAAEFQFPAGSCVGYFFNPFSAEVMEALLVRMRESFARRPGQLDLLYINDECADLFARHRGWRQLWRGELYLSPADEAADRTILNRVAEGAYAAIEKEFCSIHRWTGR